MSTRTQRLAELTYEDIEAGSVARLRQVVSSLPDEVAVHDGELSLTYAEFALRTARLRRKVAEAMQGVPAEQPIAMLFSHTAPALTGLFGVLTAGRPILVLDPRTPPARLKMFVDRVEARTCLSDEANAEVAAGLVEQVVLDDTARDPGTQRDLDEMWNNAPDPRTRVVYALTSGSTGRPKVVVHDDRMIVREAYCEARATDLYGADDVVALTLPVAFFAGLMAAYAAVLTGTTIAMYDIRGRGIGELPTWIHDNGVTVVTASPAILRNLVNSGPKPSLLAGLKQVTFAGEASYGPDIEAARALLPRTCTFRNRYGSSETGHTNDYMVGPEHPPLEGALPVGSPFRDVEVAIVDEGGNPLPPGTPGTVTHTSRFLSLGYLGDEIASQVFTTTPGRTDGTRTFRSNDVGVIEPDGSLRLLGRRDHSVKIRGYLVEPGDVDVALAALDDVRESLTIGADREGEHGGKRLISYIVSTADRPSATVARQYLAGVLPAWMVPETVIFLEALPRTDRGKLDRSALPKPPAARTGSASEEVSPWQDVVKALWCSVLALPEVSLDDDFFELGGDSLAAENLMSRMASELGVPANDAQTTVLVQAPTLRAFAERFTRKLDSSNQTLIPLRTEGSRPPLFLCCGGGGLGVMLVPLTRALPDDQPVYALQAHGLEARGIPDWSVQATARRHVKTLREVQPVGPYYIGGHSFGGVLAYEVAQQLRDAGQEVALLITLDSFPPDGKSRVPLEGGPKERLRSVLGVATTGLIGTIGEDQYWRFWRQSNFLHMRYKARKYDGPALIVIAGDSPDKGERRQWAPYLTGTWQLTHVPGDHMSMLREPFVRRTAALIWEKLEPAQRAEPSGPRRPRTGARPTLVRSGKAWASQY